MRNILLLFCLCMFGGHVNGQQPIRIMHYNLLQFGNPCPGVDLLDKYDWLGSILEHYKPDIFTVNEIGDNVLFANGIKSVSFDYSSSISFAPFTNEAGSDIVNQLFYNNRKFSLLNSSVIANPLRDINVYELYVKGSGLNGGEDSLRLSCIVAHFKAQDNASSRNQRAVAAQSIMNWIQANGQDRYVMLMGDLNIYNSSETAFQTLVFNSNQSIRLVDATGKSSGWSGSSNAIIHTQSTRSNSPDCGSGGGMDDRFDMILMGQKLMEDSSKLHYVTNSYAAFGNDGNSYNQELKCSGNTSVPVNVCVALKQMSDHHPVVVELVAEGVVSNEKQYLLSGVHMNIHGNPFGDQLRISLDYTQAKVASQQLVLDIFDASGKLMDHILLDKTSSDFVLQTAAWPKGFYFLRLSDERGRWIGEGVVRY